MKKKPSISPEEAAQWRNALEGIAPLPPINRLPPQKAPPSPRPQHSERDAHEVMEHLLDHPIDPDMLGTGDEPGFRRDGIQISVMRKLKRGQYARQAELDLHGMTVAQARTEVAAFLKQAGVRDLRCVRIIHGKGLRSSQRGPVLKPQVAHWLRQRKDVLAYCSAGPAEGGSGAVYVLLRRA